MIKRAVYPKVLQALDRQAAAALIGPRQAGKTTLALEPMEDREKLIC
jgi:predicted AAA+ superfamily ATPase